MNSEQIKVLVVDDEEAIRRNFQAYLEDLGYTVVVAADGRAGEAAFRRARPDIVLTDLRMPEEDGMALLIALQTMSPDTPVVIVSGSGSIRDAINAIRQGAWDYMLKPVQEAAELDVVIRRTLERARLMAENRCYQSGLEELVVERTTALRESEARFRTIFDAVNDAILVQDLDSGAIVEVNRRMCELYGWSRDEALSLTFADLSSDLPPYTRQEALALTARAADAAQLCEWQARDKAGRPFWVEVDIRRALVGSHERLLITVRDIGERKRAVESITRLAAAVEQAVDDILITDTAGVVQYVNSALERTTGYTRAEIVGRNARILKSGRHDETFYRELWQTISAGRTWQGRLVNRTKDGREILQDATIAPIRAPGGEVTGYVSARRDITAQVEMERHIAQADRLEAIGTLAGGVAHDFNNILGAILGFVELAMMLLPPDSEAHKDLDFAKMACGRATDLVKQIRTFSRQANEEAGPIQLKPLVKEALKFLRAALPATVELRPNILSESAVVIEASEIHRVVLNLCTNAALAMGGTGGVLEVDLRDVELDAAFAARYPGLAPGRFLRLAVRDTGCGMPPEVKARIFEPFFTTRPEAGGTGMGLSVVHGIVTNRGGVIEVSSEPGQGTTFEIFLPLAEGGAIEPLVQGIAPLPTGTERVLFVDDEAMITDIAHRLLRSLGYRIQAFTSSSEALAAFTADPQAFDLVVSDLAMPTMPGDLFLQRVRDLRPDIPRILCTGNRDTIPPEAVKALGLSEIIMKPIAVEVIAQAVRRVLDRAVAP